MCSTSLSVISSAIYRRRKKRKLFPSSISVSCAHPYSTYILVEAGTEIHPDRTLLNNGDAHFHSCKQFVLSATKLGWFLVRDNVEHSVLQWTAKHARQDTPQSNKLTA